MTAAHDTEERLDGAHEPCPTPLHWQEVLTAFEESAGGQIFCRDSHQIAVREFGEGPPLVFLPGLGGSPRLYALTAWVLKDQCRCILIDHPVWKRRPQPRQLVHATAEAWEGLLRMYAPQGAAVYAPSFGGQVALALMARDPALVSRCLLQGTWATRSLTWTERAVLELGTWYPWSLRRVPLWLSAQIQNHRQWFPPFDESRFGFLLHENSTNLAPDLAARLLASAATDLSETLPKITTPIQLLRTEGEGPPVGKTMKQLEQQLPHATTEWMPLCGQYPYLTHPHRLVKVIRKFFDLETPRS